MFVSLFNVLHIHTPVQGMHMHNHDILAQAFKLERFLELNFKLEERFSSYFAILR